MIETKGLTVQKADILLHAVDLTVNNGEIYLLMCQRERCATAISDIFAGFMPFQDGHIFMDTQPLTPLNGARAVFINRLENQTDFEPDMRLKDILDFYNCRGDVSRKRALEILLLFNLFDEDLNKKIRHCDPMDFKAFYLSLLLAKDWTNIIINDYIRGEERAFELKFNRVLIQMKNEGKAILYLTGDIFYAYRIADRVSFLKNGYLVPAEPIISRDFEELDPMEVYKKYLI